MKTFNKALVSLACLLMLAVGSSAHAADRRIWLVNKTSYTITHFYASNTSVDEWEEDILGSEVVKAWHRVRVDIDDGTGSCYFDLKAVFSDGDSVINKRFNVCTGTSWTIQE